MTFKKHCFFVLFFACCLPAIHADDEGNKAKPAKRLKAGDFAALKLRSIGPALMSGRISDLAIVPSKPNTWYVAAGSGNLWKTTNAGTTFKPIFENYGSYSIGCVTIDPNHHHVIWVGSGEAVGGRHVGFGDGVYVSRDAGQSFQNVGLTKTEHIAKILVDPRDSDTIYVAAQGPLWSPGGERGLYQSTDAGKTWKCILSKGEYTGVTDIAIDPRDPDVLFAVTHQRHRTVAALLNGGPESGIYKSRDAGATWTELKRGLPGGDKGKIAIALSPQKPDVMYATIELPERQGGFWRSTDAGESWTKQSDFISGGTGPHYYQEIFADPHRFDVVYQADVRLGRTEDGGKTWTNVSRPSKHVDNHAVAFHPTDPDFVLVGCDGGVYKSYDYAKTYDYCANLPLTQFYKLSLDNDFPIYHVVGGTQDNNSQYGPVRTLNEHGIRNSDWITTIGGDGHDNAIDPQDPNIIYCESQQGYIRRYDRRTAESVRIRPTPEKGEPDFRFNWDAPILISPHSHTRLYFGSNKLHRSDDRGDSWVTISPDLSRNEDRYKKKILNRIWSLEATWDTYAMSQFGNITSISESPLEEGLIYIGTDDGLIQVTEDGGKNWRKVEKIYGLPEYAFVNDIKADLHDVNTVYALFDNHKEGDFKPYAMRSSDRGKTWEPIVGDLPERHLCWRLVQDHEMPELLFLGTEFGIFFTVDAGEHWLKLAGAPVIPFRDLEIQQRENDLVGASFGRGFYVLDDYSPIRDITPQLLQQSAFHIFPIKPAQLYIEQRQLGGRQGSQGDSFYTAANPPFGATFTLYLRDSLKTQKARRKEAEAKIKDQGGDTPHPGFDQLRAEASEETPRITLQISDSSGTVIKRLACPTSQGLHRVSWNLRHAGISGTGTGPYVIPGTYTVQASMRVGGETKPLGEPAEFQVKTLLEPTLPAQEAKAVLAYQREVGRYQKLVLGTVNKVDEVLQQLGAIQRMLKNTLDTAPELVDEARNLELRLQAIHTQLTTDAIREQHNVMAVPGIMDRISQAYSQTLGSLHGPTQTQRQDYILAKELYQELHPAIKQAVNVDFEKLKSQLDAAGVPWTTGRKLP